MLSALNCKKREPSPFVSFYFNLLCLLLLQFPYFHRGKIVQNKKKMCDITRSKGNISCDCVSFWSIEAAGNGETGMFRHCHRSGEMPLL